MEKRISILNVLTYIVVIIGIVGGIYGSGQYVDNRIKRTVNDEQFIKKVASHVRPYAIFDAKETIHVDGGAMQFLEKIEVEKLETGKEELADLKITVTPKNHLAYAPHIEILSPPIVNYYITQKRGSAHQWIYELFCVGRILGPDEKEPPSRFRLEILR